MAVVLAAGCVRAPRHQMHLLPTVSSETPLPPGFGAPLTPPDNPLTAAKANLGRHLFYDRRLSYNQKQSCASCHDQRNAFTDGRAHAIGSTGEEHYRNAMGLANVGYRRPLTWADPETLTLEQQVLVPLTNRDPIELGMAGHFDELLARIGNDPTYKRLFAAAFPTDPDPVTLVNVARALASFERTIISGASPYDRLVRYGDSGALSPAAWNGMRLFFSARLGCSSCHGGPDFGTPERGSPFANNGTYARYPARDRGLANKTGRRGDAGKFRIPSLRNVAVTAPYMHDGSAMTLSDVIDDYAAGGRAARLAHQKPGRAAGVRSFEISPKEKRELIAFLESLTDQDLLTNPRLGDPWKEREGMRGSGRKSKVTVMTRPSLLR
jgi:cytochrome c peroxidase